MMKKRFLLIAVAILCLLDLSAARYDMPLIGLSVDIPDDYYVKEEANPLTNTLLKGAMASDPVYSEYTDYVDTGVSTCLVAKAPMNTMVLTVTAAYSPQIEENLHPSDSEISENNEASLSALDIIGGEYIDSGSYSTDFAKYGYMYIRMVDFGMYSLAYSLSLDNYAVTFTFVQTFQFDDSDMDTVRAIIDSVGRGNEESGVQSAMSQTFTDYAAGVSFEIPDGFTVLDQNSTSCSMLNSMTWEVFGYASTDAYSALPQYLRGIIKRSDINMNTFTETDIAASVGVPRNRVSTRTINGTEFFVIKMMASDMPELLIPDCLYYSTYRNGYEIGFMYSMEDDPWNYSRAESLIRQLDI